MTSEAKSTKEETTYTVKESTTDAKQEQGSGSSEGRFKIPGMQAGRELASQLLTPWFHATATTLEQVHDLNQRLFSKTQEAMTETFDFMNEGINQVSKVSQRTHQAMQDQLKRFAAK